MSVLMAPGKSPIGAKSAMKPFTVRISTHFIISVISATTDKMEIFWCIYNLTSSGMHGMFLSWTLFSDTYSPHLKKTRGSPSGSRSYNGSRKVPNRSPRSFL